jgi:hypothetical protein
MRAPPVEAPPTPSTWSSPPAACASAPVPDSMPGEDVGKVLGWVKANRAGLREILKGGQDPDLEAARAEGSKA